MGARPGATAGPPWGPASAVPADRLPGLRPRRPAVQKTWRSLRRGPTHRKGACRDTQQTQTSSKGGFWVWNAANRRRYLQTFGSSDVISTSKMKLNWPNAWISLSKNNTFKWFHLKRWVWSSAVKDRIFHSEGTYENPTSFTAAAAAFEERGTNDAKPEEQWNLRNLTSPQAPSAKAAVWGTWLKVTVHFIHFSVWRMHIYKNPQRNSKRKTFW